MSDIQTLIKEFNTLVSRKEKAEKLYDDPTTTDADREKWYPGVLEICNKLNDLSKELRQLGYDVKPEAFWEGIEIE